MLAPPTKTIITRNMSDRFDIMRLTFCCDLTICCDGRHLGVGQQTIDFVQHSRGNLLAARDDFNGVDHRSLFGQVLNRVQMGENARIVHRAGLRQNGRHGELLAEHFKRIGLFELENGGDFSPNEDFVLFER